MALDDGVFGGGDQSATDETAQRLMEQYQPADGQAFSSDPVELTQRLLRKMNQPSETPKLKGVDFDKATKPEKPEAKKAPDLSSFGEPAPDSSSEDLSSFGDPVKEPEPPKPGVLATLGNEGTALGKGLVRGAPEAVGSMMQGGAALSKQKPESPESLGLINELQNSGAMTAGERAKLMGRALRTVGDRGLQIDFNAALQRIARGGDPNKEATDIRAKYGLIQDKAATPVEDTPLYKAGKATKDWIDKTVPMTEQEQASVGGQVGTGVSSMLPYLAAGIVAGPEVGLVLGAAGMGTQTAGDTFQAAKKAGASDEKAVTAAGWGGAVGAALGTLPLGAVFKPVSAASDTWKAWFAAKLVQAGQSGMTFATVGEAQQYLLQQIAKEQYDPKAGYSPDAKRVISSLLTGGALGVVHPLHSNLSTPQEIQDFIRQANGEYGARTETNPDGTQTHYEGRDMGGGGRWQPPPGWRNPEQEAAHQRGAQARSEIDDFIRAKDAKEAAAAPGLPKPEGGEPEAASGTLPEPPVSPTRGEPTPPTEKTETEGLKRYGWSDDEIAAMSPAQRRAEFQSAMAEGQSEKPAAANPHGLSDEEMAFLKTQGWEGKEIPGPDGAPELHAALHQRRAATKSDVAPNTGADQHALRAAAEKYNAATVAMNRVLQVGPDRLPLGDPERARLVQERADARVEYERLKEGAPLRSPADAAMEGLTDLFKGEVNPVPGTRAAPIKPETGADVFHAQAAEPTPAQAGAENYRHSHMAIEHLGLVGKNSISIETGAGQKRSSVDADGTVHENVLPFPYGRIKGTKGADGEPLDITIGPNPKSPHVFVIDQHHNDGSGFDEHKIMAGFDTPQEAIVAYGAAYDDLGGNRIGHVTAMTPDEFKTWREGDTTQPLKKHLSADEIGGMFDEIVGGDEQKGGEPGKPNGGVQDQGSPQLPHAQPDGGPKPARAGAEKVRHVEGEVIRPGDLTPPEQEALDDKRRSLGWYEEEIEAGQRFDESIEHGVQDERDENAIEQHHAQIEAALGADYHHVLPVDVARAAEILAEKPGITPQLAFQYAVIENAAAQKFLTTQQLEQAYGPEVKTLLVSGRERPPLLGGPVDKNGTTTEQEPTSGGEEGGELPRGGKTSARDRAEDTTVADKQQHDAAGGEPNSRRKAGDNAAEEGRVREQGAEGSDNAEPAEVEEGDEQLTTNEIAALKFVLKGKHSWHRTSPMAALAREILERGRTDGKADEDALVSALNAHHRHTNPEEYKSKVQATVERGRAAAEKINSREAKREKEAFAKLEGEAHASLADAFTDRLKGDGFKNILDARRLAKEHGVEDLKQVEETLELAAVKAAREIVATSKAPYPELVALYGKQPKLGTRTSTSVRDQAYSTPVPLAYVADRLAGITKDTTVYEPTAGNGALLIAADPKKVYANEINPIRRANLEAQGFKVTGRDATDTAVVTDIKFVEETGVDVVISNPPFGVVKENGESKSFGMQAIQPGYRTNEIDHAIALRSLAAMKDDGRAVLILGGLNKQVTTEAGRSDAYNGKSKREFYKTLYDNYGVTDHFTVAGELYERQGAGWPVDVIVINGRGKSERALPAVDVPRIYDSWDALGGLLDGQEAGENAGAAVRPDGGALEERPGLAGRGQPDRAVARRGGAGSGNGQGEPGAVRAEPVRGQLETVGAGGNGAEEPGGHLRGRPAGRSGEQPAAERPSSRLSADEIGDIFDELVPEADTRSTAEVAKSAATHALSAADEALSGLTELFGGGKTIGMGLNIDEDTYAKAKPLFIEAAEKFSGFKHDIRELMRRMVDHLRDALKWTTEMLRKARPYMIQFVQDVQDGTISLLKPEAAKPAARPSRAVETAGQSVYEPQSKQPGLDTLVPVNMKKSIADALAGLEKKVGPIDDFVADKLGYDKGDLEKYFGAEQVDALGLAIDNLNKGNGFIIGDQCVAGETLIYDPLFDRHVRIDELASASVPHAVLALTAEGFAPHAAVVTFKKGRADLYRVTLEDGRSIVVTQQHRFLTPHGWDSVAGHVCSGTLIAIAQDADTSSLATRGAYGPRASRKPQDCLDRCWSDHHPCGEQSRSGAEIDPIVAQLRDDALGHILASSHTDGPAPSPEHSPLSRGADHHSKRSSSPSESHALDATEAYAFASGERSPRPTLQNEQQCHGWSASCSGANGEALECEPCALDHDSSGVGARQPSSDGNKSSPPSLCGAAPTPARSAPSGSRARLLPAWSPVRSIEFVRFDDFYDLYVPGPENYVAQGFVNHNTGIGKGRVNAAILKWAMRKGRVPVFTTEKPGLYADMFRDMTDIGMDPPRILATNAALSLPLDDAGKVWIKTGNSKKHNAHMLSLTDPEDFKKHYDMVFTNYSQMQTLKGEDTARRRFLQMIMPRSTIVFDESHNAGGQTSDRKPNNTAADRADFARDLVSKANGVFYSSATYAKRPDVMSLYASTDMAMAVEDIDSLGEAIAKGGIPMQQVVAAMLSKAGQYIRRERSFHGINYNTPSVDVDHDTYDQISHSLAAIQEFSVHVKEAAKEISQALKAEAKSLGHDNAVSDAGASSTTFTSKMHNIINQMLLAMKAPEAAKMAIAHIRNGEKPVLTVANTMEAFLKDYADELGINQGDPIEADFSDVLTKYLDRSRRITIRKPFPKAGEKPSEHYVLSDADLGPLGVQAYNDAKAMIAGMDLSHLPISPIDHIKSELEKAGYEVGEITGRGLMVDYSGKQPVLRSRPGADTTTKGRNEMRRRFNLRPSKDGLHAIIINQAGSTGISMHSGEKFDDKSKRRMMIVQPEANIDTHMQLLGRVNRTGQMVLPEYDQLVANIPAEKRPAAVLAKKMASLNANTTASRTSAVTAKDVPDFINQWGDLVAAGYLNDNMEMNERLAWPVKPGEGKLKAEDAMRKLTGRIPLLPLKQQEELYAHLEEEYAALIQQMEASGTSPLEAKTMDLKARTLETSEVQGPKNKSGSPFAAPVNVEKVSVLRQGKPFKPEELVDRLGQRLGAPKNGSDVPIDKLADWLKTVADPIGNVTEREERFAKVKEFDAYSRAILNKAEDAKAQEVELAKHNAIKDRWTSLHTLLPIGTRVRLNMVDASPVAVVLDVKQTSETKNPLALGSWKVNFAVADASRQVTLPFSRLYLQGAADPESMLDVEVVHTNESAKDTLARFEVMQSGTREDRYIATGNLLAAYDWLNMKGSIINYSDAQGAVRQGIITPKDFKLGEHAIKKGRIVSEPDEIKTLLDQNQTLWSKDKQVNISRADRWSDNYEIQTEKKKATGGRYYLDKDLTDLTGDFYSRGGMMTATVSGKNFPAALERLQKIGAQFTVAAAAPKAQKVDSPEPPPDDEPPTTPGSGPGIASLADASSPVMQREASEKMGELRHLLRGIVQRLAGPGFKVDFHDGLIPLGEVPPGYDKSMTPKAAGQYRLSEPLIQLALMPGRGDVMQRTAFHESYHAIEDKLQTGAERELMKQETPRLREWIKGKTKMTDAQVDKLAGYEVRAIAFQEYSDERFSRSQTGSGLHIGVRRWFDRLIEALRSLANGLRGLGFKTYADIFDAAHRGEFAAREHGEGAIREGDLAAASEMFKDDASHDNSIEDVLGRRLLGRLSDLNLTEARTQLQDKFARVKIAEDSVSAPSRLSAYQAESLYYGRTGYRLEQLNDKHIDPILKEMKARGIAADDLDEFLSARHAPERNNKLGELREPGHDFNRAINDHDVTGASGWSTNEALGVIRAVKAKGKLADYLAVAKMIDALNYNTRRTLLNAGLISRDTFDAWNSQYKYYVPYRGWAEGTEDPESLARQGSGMNIRGKEAKQAFGRKSRSASPLAYSIMQAELAVVRAEKNRVGNTFLKFVQEYPDEDRWVVDRPKMIQRINPTSGLVTSIPDNLTLDDDNVFSTKVDGRTVKITLKGRDGINLARALKNMGSANAHALVRAIGAVTRTMSKLATSFNPEFMLPNFARDLGEAFINLQQYEQRGFIRNFLKHIRPSLEGSMLALAGKTPDPASKAARYVEAFHRFDKAGGRVRFFGLDDPDHIESNVKRKLKRLEGGAINNLKDVGDKAAKAVEVAGGGIENATRLAAFMAAEDAGFSTADAAMLARNLTVDFNKKGELGTVISALYMFANAGIQGQARMMKALGHRRVWQAVGALAAANAIATLFSLYMGGDDEAGTPNYMKIPGWERDKNMIFMLGKEDYVKIPMPYGFSPFAVIGSHAVTTAMGHEKPGKAASSIIESILNAFNPLGEESSMLMDLIPSAIRPSFHVAFNKNWTGRPLYPEQDRARGNKPDSTESFRTDSAFSKEAAKDLNAWSGGNSYQSGAVDVHPATIDHYLQAITGGVGRFAKGVVDTIISGTHGEWQPEKTPIVRRFVGKVGEEADRAAYYDQRQSMLDQEASIAQAKKDRRSGANVDEANEFLRDAGKVNRQKEIFNNADERLKALRLREERITNGTAPDDEKRAAISALHETMRKIENQARGRVNRLPN